MKNYQYTFEMPLIRIYHVTVDAENLEAARAELKKLNETQVILSGNRQRSLLLVNRARLMTMTEIMTRESEDEDGEETPKRIMLPFREESNNESYQEDSWNRI